MKKTLSLVLILISFYGLEGKAQSAGSLGIKNWNTIQKAGFYHALGTETANGPMADGAWWWGFNSPSESNLVDNTFYNAQIVMKFGSNPVQMYVRSTDPSGNGAWAKVLHDQGAQNMNGNLTIKGNIVLSGISDLNFKTFGRKIYFGNEWENTDNMWISRFNFDTDQSDLRLCLGDDSSDRFMIGYWQYGIPSTDPNGYKSVFTVNTSGKIGIGTINPSSELEVKGTIKARAVEITIDAGADFVFQPDYNLKPLSEVEQFVKKNKHLPEIPSEKQMIEEGVNVTDMQIKLLQKIEELTLYTIQQQKLLDTQIMKNNELENRINKLENK